MSSDTCTTPCDGGCDQKCMVHATWKPDPARKFRGHGPGFRVEHDGNGGGILFKRSKVTGRWVRFSSFKPHGA